MSTVHVQTLGCKANASDSVHIEASLHADGFKASDRLETADVVVINSCTVTDEAQRQSEQAVKRARKLNPHSKIIFTGCAAEVDPDRALKIPGVTAVLGNQNKSQIAHWVRTLDDAAESPVILGGVSGYEELKSKHPMDRNWPALDGDMDQGREDLQMYDVNLGAHRTRVFLNIQEGCNEFCTYCIIPYGRGPSRFVPMDRVISQIKQVVQSGAREVILTGTNIGAYGDDPLALVILLRRIFAETTIERIRVGSLDPTEITDDLLQLMADEERFCPHFHVSLQHTDSRVLKLMKRKYTSEDVKVCLNKLAHHPRSPFVGMDVIVGFPGETDAIFEEMVSALREWPWSRIHVFPYSERSGTPATRLPQSVPVPTRRERAKKLQALSLQRLIDSFSALRSQPADHIQGGLLKDVLLEGQVKGPDGTRDWVSGYSPNYQRVLFSKESLLDFPDHARNQILTVEPSTWTLDRASGDIAWIAHAVQVAPVMQAKQERGM